jgi:hypothetical protein
MTARVRIAGIVGLATLLGVLAVASSAGASTPTITLYASETQRIFINNTDDLARGQGRNPFDNYLGSGVSTVSNELLFGPFPGDEGQFGFTLYTSRSHRKVAGSAVFICQYGFDANDFCDSAYTLPNGTLIAKGNSNFNAHTSTYAILGGTSHYRGVVGSVRVVALGKATQPQPLRRIVPMLQQQRLELTLHSGQPQ